MELGIYGAVLVFLLLARRRHELAPHPARDTALFFTVAGLVMVMFIGSSVITNNDFGYRAVMLPQFFLTLLAADLLGSWSSVWLPSAETTPVLAATPGRRRWVYSLLALGIAGTLYWAVLLRAWLPIEAARPQDGFDQLPQDAFALRSLFADLDRSAPLGAVVAFRPIDPITDRHDEVITPSELYQRILVMDTGRQMLNAEHDCAVQFGGDPRPCSAIQSATRDLYALPAPSADSARSYCLHFGVRYLLIGHHDPAWPATQGWPVTLPVVAEQPTFKLLDCASPRSDY
jgi:hypothetical protein